MRARILQLQEDALLSSGMAEAQVEMGSEAHAEPPLQSEPDSTLLDDAGGEKTRRKSKTRAHRPIVESLHIKTMVASYKHHIAVYSKDREQVNQLIPSAVWKGVYANYIKQFPNSPFVEETLKDRLRETIKEMQTGKYVDEDGEHEKASPLQSNEVVARLKDRLRETLKELRNGTFNEEDFEKAVLQSDEVFQDFEKASLKSEEHATRIALKRKLNPCIDGGILSRPHPLEQTPHTYSMPATYAPPAPPPPPPPTAMMAPRSISLGAVGYRPIAPAPAANYVQPGPYVYAACMQQIPPSATSGPSSMPSPHLSSTSPPTMSKDEILQQQSRSITAIATQFLSNSEKRDALLAAELECHRAKSEFYNEKTRKLKIGNLRLLREAGVMSDEEFKHQVKHV